MYQQMSTISDTSSLISQPIRYTVIHTLLPHGVSQILVFGSYATGNSTPESDLDLIVSFHSQKDLFDMGGMREDLIDALGVSGTCRRHSDTDRG